MITIAMTMITGSEISVVRSIFIPCKPWVSNNGQNIARRLCCGDATFQRSLTILQCFVMASKKKRGDCNQRPASWVCAAGGLHHVTFNRACFLGGHCDYLR